MIFTISLTPEVFPLAVPPEVVLQTASLFTSPSASLRSATGSPLPPEGFVVFLLLGFISYYTRGQTWEEAANLATVDPDSPQAGEAKGQLATTLGQLKVKYEIDIGKTTGPYTANAEGSSITVDVKNSTTAPGEVPPNYVRYKHAPSTTPFKLGLVRYNDVPLKFEPDLTTESVKAVYVYYHKDNDPKHEFPLIVCVSTGPSTQTYYKRGNEWAQIPNTEINLGPEDPGVDGQLSTPLSQFIQQYEVKLEKPAGDSYKARPQPNTNNPNITVSAIDQQVTAGITATFKGFRHPIPRTADRVNRITIHGHITDGIDQTEIEKITFQTSGGVYVYFSKDGDDDLQRPYLICLSPNGDANGNTWYKRVKKKGGETGYEWENANAEIGTTTDPGNINAIFAGKLGNIKGELNKGDKTDTGYITLDLF